MKRTIGNNRIPHAYLFTGTDEEGKRVAAKELAKALNCEKNEGEACDVCSSCCKIERGVHPDVQVVSVEGKSGGIKIEQIHAIRERIFLKPLEGRYKFYIIEQAERLIKPQEASGNALLKLLEEPPRWTVFVLIPTENQMLLLTIVSRCQKIKFDYVPKMKAGQDEVFDNFRRPFLKNLLAWSKELSADRERAIDALDVMMLCMRDTLIYMITRRRDLLMNADCEMAQGDTVDGVLRKMDLVQRTRRLIEQNINIQLALDVMFMEMCDE